MAKKLDLFLSIFGKDNTGSMFSSVLGKAKDLKGGMGDVTGSMRDGMIQAELFTKGLDLGLQAATAGVGALKNAFMGAAATEQSLLSVSNNYAAISGVSFDQAEESMGRINARLTENAAILPGQTKGYRDLGAQIADTVLPAFKSIDGLNMKGAEDALVGLSTNFGLMGASAGVATEDVSKGLSKALSGKSLSELGDLLFFEQNPAILSEIETQLKAKNVEQLSDLDQKARLDLIQSVGVKFSSPEYIDKIGKTTGALLEGFATTLFDQTTGVFGLMRDLDDKTKGSQSVYQQMGSVLDLVIGEKGVLGKSGPVASLFSAIGLKLPDPMRVLYNVFSRTVGFLEGAVEIGNAMAEKVKGGMRLGKAFSRALGLGFGDFKFDGAKLGAQFGTILTENSRKGYALLNKALVSIPWGPLGVQIGSFLGSGAVTLFRNVPWIQIGKFLINALAAVGEFLGSVLEGILRGLAVAIGDWVKDSATGALRAVARAPGRAVRATGNALQRNADAASEGSARRVASTRARRSAEGFTPAGEPDILSLIAAERNAAPGAGILVANDSEHVLPGAAVRAAVGAGVGGGGGRAGGAIASRQIVNNFSPTIVLPSGSTQAMAQEVLRILNGLVSEGLEAQLT